MKRKQIKQISNLNWFPKLFKTLIAEFLSWFVLRANASKPFIPLILEILEASNTKNIINIHCNLGAGIDTLLPFLSKDIEVSSLHMNQFNTQHKGLYVYVNTFHQLPSNEARKSLKQIAASRNPVVVVEGNNDSLWQIVGMTFFVPLSVLLSAPFVKPFRISRLVFTYLIPIVPIVIVIDGCLALLKLYNPKDLQELVTNLNIPNYEWKIGKNENGRGGKIIYLTGQAL